MRFNLSREFYIPRQSSKVADRKSDAVAYIFTAGNGRPAYAIFYGKQAKPVARYSSKDEAERVKRVGEWFKARQRTLGAKAEWKARAAAAAKSFEVGDVLCSSWGYEQTNVFFYQIIARKGAKLTIHKISAEKIDNKSAMVRLCRPDGR